MSDIRFNQWFHNSGTGGVSQDSAGHVGIGTTVPTHVNALTNNNSILHVGIVSCNTLNSNKIEGTIDDWIVHEGDTNTKFGFPADDTFSVETAGQQNVQVNGTRTLLKSPSGTNTTVRLQHQGNSGYGDIILDRTVNAFIIDNDPGNAGSNGTYFSVKNKGTENLRITHDGYVGINDPAPEVRFHVYEPTGTGGTRTLAMFQKNHTSTALSGNMASNGYPHALILENQDNSSDTGLSSLCFSKWTSGSQSQAVIAGISESAGNMALTFNTETSNTIGERLRINSVGGVVVNGQVVDPDVSGGAFTGGVFIKAYNADTVGSGAGIRFGSASGSKETFGTISALHTSGNNGDMAFNMYAGGSTHPERMRLNSSGQLLLGGTSSTIANAKLQVFGTSNTNNIVITNTSASDASQNRYSKIKFRGTQSGGEVSTLADITAHHEGASDDEKGSLLFKTNDGDDGDSPTERMRIYADGHATFFGEGPFPNPGTTDTRFFNGGMSVADDSSVTFTSAANTGALVCVGSYKRSGGSVTYASALFFVTYGSNNVTKIADPRGIFSNGDSDGSVCVLKSSSTDGTFTVKNRIGTTNTISVNIIGLQGL